MSEPVNRIDFDTGSCVAYGYVFCEFVMRLATRVELRFA